MALASGFLDDMLNRAVPGDTQEAVRLVAQIVAWEAQATSGKPTGGKPFAVGDLVPYLRTYHFIQRNPWAPYAAVGLGILGLVGFAHLVTVGRG